MQKHIETEERLYQFIREIYGDPASLTRVEVNVEAQSGGAYGTPHLEVSNVRIYAGEVQLLPDFEQVPYWKEVLATYPYLFDDCSSNQSRLDTVQEFLKRERLYLEYGLDWPDVGEKVSSVLCFTFEELHQMTMSETAEKGEEEEELGENEEKGEQRLDVAIACAEAALVKLGEEWVQNMFGDTVTDVLFNALHLFIDTCRKKMEDQRLIAKTPDQAFMLQQAVNTISFMLMNITDADDHCNPESGEIYSDVVRGALYLDEAIKAGIIPNNYGKDGIAQLIEEVKAQQMSQTGEGKDHSIRK